MHFVPVCSVPNWNSVILFALSSLLAKGDNSGHFSIEKNCGSSPLASKDGIMNSIEEDDTRHIMHLLLSIWFKTNHIQTKKCYQWVFWIMQSFLYYMTLTFNLDITWQATWSSVWPSWWAGLYSTTPSPTYRCRGSSSPSQVSWLGQHPDCYSDYRII